MTKPLSVLIVAPWFPAGPLIDISVAFERMGCTVFRVGPTFNTHMGVDWGKDEVHPDVLLQDECWDLNRLLDLATMDSVKGHTPDLILVSDDYKCSVVPTTKVPVALWSLDGWPQVYKRVEVFQPTAAFHNHPFGIRIHPQEKIPEPWQYMPAACAPWKHHNLKMDRDVDFALMATPYGARPILCDYLRNQDLSVLSGLGNTEAYVQAYNRASFTYHNTNGNGHEIKFRFFESSAMGCVNICDDWLLLEELGYIKGFHFLPIALEAGSWNGEDWPTGESLHRIVADFQKQPFVVQSMSEWVSRFTIKHHSYYNRANQVLASLGFDELEIPNGY